MTHPKRPREVRLFVSSTFLDFVDERNRLTLDAFPRLRRFSAERGVAFTEIDLRWGITDAEARACRVLDICLDEVERCADYPPFLVGLLGDRYGWIPDEADWTRAMAASRLPPQYADIHRGQSITELEIRTGVLDRPEMIPHAFFYFREPLPGTTDARQELLKAHIRACGACVRENIRSPQELSDLLVQDLAEAIDRRYPQSQTPSALERLIESQERHRQSLLKTFITTQALLEGWRSILDGEDSVCLAGESGTGKSAFLAGLHREATRAHPANHVFLHHAGIGTSRTRFAWIAHLFHWARNRGLTTLEVPERPAKLQAELPVLLASFPPSEPILLALDAIDQLEDGEHLEGVVPDNPLLQVRWLVSTTDRTQTELFHRRGWKVLHLPPFQPAAAKAFICSELERYRKRLPEHHLESCSTHPQASTPLFLKILCEELRACGSHETLENRIAQLLSERDAAGLFAAMMRRIEHDLGKDAIQVLVSIGLARQGVSEPELRSCLELRPLEVHRTVLLADPYLSANFGRIVPFHEGLGRAMRNYPLAADTHARWVSYWKSSTDEGRRFMEYPWFLARDRNHETLASWLLEEATLSYAWETQQVEALVPWYELSTPYLPEDGPNLDGWALSALRGLREMAYQAGVPRLEKRALLAQETCSNVNRSQWCIDQSLFHYRRGEQEAALVLAREAERCAVPGRASLDASLNLAQMLAFGTNPAQALELCRVLVLRHKDLLASDLEAQVFLSHYQGLACHFLDLNQQSLQHGLKSAEQYGAQGRRYDQGISWVNAGDGAWGTGRHAKAEQYFHQALDLAAKYRLPHVRDIALICMGNLRMSQGRLKEAIVLYHEGITLAHQIGQAWDALYGQIYLALTQGLEGAPHEDLTVLAHQAEADGLGYLSDLAGAYGLLLAEYLAPNWELLAISPFPGPRAYALAAACVHGHNRRDELQGLLNTMEGLKGPTRFIHEVLPHGSHQ